MTKVKQAHCTSTMRWLDEAVRCELDTPHSDQMHVYTWYDDDGFGRMYWSDDTKTIWEDQ